MVNAPLESLGESGRYGVSWSRVSIPRPDMLDDAWNAMNKLYIDAFYSGSERDYLNDTYSELAPEINSEFEAIRRYSSQRPTVSLLLCLRCGTSTVTTDLKEILESVDVLTQWIEAEVEARKQKQKAKQKKVREEKRKNYEKQIAALQKKLDKFKDD